MRAASLDELAQAPVGRYVRGETYVHFCADRSLWGVLLWGRSVEAHALQLGRSLVLELSPPAEPHVSIVDASRLESGDAKSFERLERYVKHYGEALRQWVLRLALVRPKGLGGAIVAGAYEVLPRPYPVAVFDELRAALDWLAEAAPFQPPPAEMTLLMNELFASVSGTPPVLEALRHLLDRNLAGIAVADAASALGLSDRTLQRRLGDAGTTFQDEMAEARLRAAQRLLLEGDEPVTTIAFEVGCASPQYLNALFRKRTGQSPTEWRRRRR